MAASRKPRRDASVVEVAALRALVGTPHTPETTVVLRRALEGRSAIVVAKAAALAQERGLRELAPDFSRAFGRFLESAVERDPGCTAKLALARALITLETEDAGVFLQGVRHIQQEPVWGGRIDTAGPLRGTCLQGLVAMGHRDALFEAVPLLVDERVEARRLAAEALAMVCMDQAELLLRFKVLAGDEEPLVLADVFAALMAVNASRSLEFVARHLGSADADVARGAALAIGESRHEEAFGVLRRAHDSARLPETRELFLLPMALTRSEPAFELLLSLVVRADASPEESADSRDTAAAAMRALRLFKNDEVRLARIEQLLKARRDPRLDAAFQD